MEPTQPVTQTKQAAKPLYVEGAGLLSDSFQTAQAASLDFEQLKKDTCVSRSSAADTFRQHISLAKNDIREAASVLHSKEVPKHLQKNIRKYLRPSADIAVLPTPGLMLLMTIQCGPSLRNSCVLEVSGAILKKRLNI